MARNILPPYFLAKFDLSAANVFLYFLAKVGYPSKYYCATASSEAMYATTSCLLDYSAHLFVSLIIHAKRMHDPQGQYFDLKVRGGCACA